MTERFQKTVLLLICILGSSTRQILNAEKLYGLYSDELISGQLVIPQRIDRNGEFVTHNLTHHHKQHYGHHSRRQRSLIDDSVESNHKNLDDYLHYRLNLENETLHLELEPHTYFLAPNLIVERHRRDLRTRSRPTRNTHCHYHGKVRGQGDSRVAISTCDGLVGHIKTKNNEYFIEPSKHHDAHPVNGHPHVVFHRSSVKQKEQSNKANKPKRKKHKRKQHKQQHHHQQQQQQQLQQQPQHAANQQRVPVSNCGTREPRRRTETRLEWQPLGKVKIQGGRKIRRHRNNHHLFNHHRTPNWQRRPHHHSRRRHHHHQTPAKYEYQTTADATVVPLPQHEPDDNGPTSMARGNDIVGTSQRTKRSISSPRHVETLIVADETMVAFHGDVETYLLSIMNMVSALYKDPTIGNSIEIVVVKIALLNETDATHPHLNLTLNAQQNLDTFCSWQHTLNSANKKDPYHHDVAILVTRKNICGENCMTLGLANVGGMCKPRQSCSVNEDNGIMLSHTIAHELGHNFGMFHDTAKIGCHPRIGSIVHIMTPTFGADTLQVSWSNCSRKFITHFLDQGLGDCLDDAPTPPDEYHYPENPPGVIFNAELQCRLQFNVTDGNVGVCSSMNEICSQLWCRVNDECVTNMRPTAPGTSCGQNMWCQNGQCVHKTEVTPVNGGWGKWSKWSKCSRSCGGGVSIQQRECNNPLPENGGLFCIGERKRYKVCEQQACPPSEPSFRAEQCSNFDHVMYQGGKYKWLPFFDKNNPCKLFCTDVDDTVIANWGDVVLDGTPCTLGTNNMCIDGICRKIGCDWVVDSDLQEDRCGICGGKGDQCQPVKEVFNEPFNATEGYVEIVTIPARARHIIVRELGNSPNFLAISKEKDNQFYLNGDSLISMPGEFVIAGAESLYDRIDEQETINIPQPIEHSIAVYVIVRSAEPNDGIYYEFTLPAVNLSNPNTRYNWELSDWTPCSTTCGGGLQYREALCHENGKVIPSTELCWSFAKNRRPLRLTRGCNKKQCPAHWWVGPWQFCPVTCSTPNSPYPVKRRSVMCLDQNEVVVEDAKCSGVTRPPETEACESLPLCKKSKSTAELVSTRNENLILRVKNV